MNDTLLWEKARDFHGHECGGLTIGYKAVCGEITMESMMRLEDGKKVCLDCYHPYSRFE